MSSTTKLPDYRAHRGIYVRHMSVEFQKKDFTQTYELRNHICTFKHSAMDEVESIEYKPSAELINDQIRLLDTMESQAVSPQLLHGYIEKILKNSPNQPQMLFAKYLNYMRCKEYVQAINCLHHYFEEMDFRSTTNEQKLKKRFCYFPLNLAILHCLLGHNAEAIHALTEAIRLAQEGSDQECLLHAIHWLYWIKKEEHSTESLTLLNQLMKLSENVSSKISGYAALNTIREEVLKGNEPSGIFYRLTTDDALISQSSLNDLSPTLFAEIAAIWSHYGINSLVVLHCQLLLGGFTNEDKRLNDEIIGLQFCKLSSYFEKEGYPSVAMKILDYALTIFPEHTEQAELLEISKKKLAFENALMKGEISLAKALSTELATTDSLEFSYSRAIIMKETNQFAEACNLLYKMLQDADEDKVILRNKLITLPQHRIRILRLLGEIYLESKQPCKAIEYFLQSVTCAYSYHLLDSMIASMIGLAEAQFSIGLSTTALDLLNDIAVSVSSFVSPILRAKFWTMTAKLHWKLANRRLPLRHILNLLDHAGTIFESRNYYFGLREVFYMKV
ncbi:uncharacterized protein TRIADDRAFT_53387 [Trichoplax adhaerens]|uniref:Anaphase-promoting complex subunit 5 n=1 Tax=Trichoplax adhaerens TaxID=10228 RepID=B3RP33_TRIAD|nr:hypothetical protein TRIADDRAFT_53387 [Trichoplax adhaerens]EDV27564.1 hypothetical protein TRIADDRAFT_53387 [Trichoplax adhaerens]|eukprot:XP_002109398.1 hypothetical protein TRIADDRAFT_53387 [Trichoplax adhaerens]